MHRDVLPRSERSATRITPRGSGSFQTDSLARDPARGAAAPRKWTR